MKKEILKAMNEQINLEFSSAYFYLNMAIAMEEVKLNGFASWLRKQWHEELEHAEKLIAFIEERNETPTLSSFDLEEVKDKKPLAIAKAVLKHEQMVTSGIWTLRKLAVELGDQASEVFLNWYVNEQVEEEKNAQSLVDMFELAGDDKLLTFTVDTQLANRG